MAAPVHNGPWIEQILGLHANFTAPKGCKSEVVEGLLVVSASVCGRRGLIYDELHARLRQLMPATLAVTNTMTLDMIATSERYVPDLLVIGKDVLDTDDWLLDAAAAELVVEIVSWPDARADRLVKVRGYAASGVPIYLLIDPLEQAVTLFYEPAGDAYQHMHRVPFGSDIALPEPFRGKIETGAFA